MPDRQPPGDGYIVMHDNGDYERVTMSFNRIEMIWIAWVADVPIERDYALWEDFVSTVKRTARCFAIGETPRGAATLLAETANGKLYRYDPGKKLKKREKKSPKLEDVMGEVDH